MLWLDCEICCECCELLKSDENCWRISFENHRIGKFCPFTLFHKVDSTDFHYHAHHVLLSELSFVCFVPCWYARKCNKVGAQKRAQKQGRREKPNESKNVLNKARKKARNKQIHAKTERRKERKRKERERKQETNTRKNRKKERKKEEGKKESKKEIYRK